MAHSPADVLEEVRHALVVEGIAARDDPNDPRLAAAGRLLLMVNRCLAKHEPTAEGCSCNRIGGSCPESDLPEMGEWSH
jgi:hypothetical protein